MDAEQQLISVNIHKALSGTHLFSVTDSLIPGENQFSVVVFGDYSPASAYQFPSIANIDSLPTTVVLIMKVSQL